MKEVHLFILWEKARNKEIEILDDIKKNFNIIGLYNIKWSKEKFSNNLSRFYGTNLPENSGKEQHCGNGDFLLVIVEVENPIYEERETSKGIQKVNINMFDKKTYYRELTGGGHKIHATNSVAETNHDLTLLLGKNVQDYLKERNNYSQIITLEQDLVGANGFTTVNEMFYVLNNCINYAIIRNYESLPEEIYINEHNDIDIICDSLENAAYILNGEKVFPEDYRVHYKVKVEDKYAFFDLRHLGDGYYDYNLELDILKTKVLNEKGFFTISNELYFYALIYHAIIHKPIFAEDYRSRLIKMNTSNIVLNSEEDFICILNNWLIDEGYLITKPKDESVLFNQNNVSKFDYELFNDNENISLEVANLNSNIIDWYPFEKEKTILVVNDNLGVITENLCKKLKNVVIVEKYKRNAEKITKILKHNNFEVINDDFTKASLNTKFDYILLNGITENRNPLSEYLECAKKYLKEKGVILLTCDNEFGLANLNINVKKQKKEKYLSKNKIERTFKQLGIKNYKFYYPLPSYKEANVIFSDNYLPDEESILRDLTLYEEEQIIAIDEREKYKEIIEENINLFSFFANSYFIEISEKENEIKYISFNNSRKEQYRVKTIMKEEYVYKKEYNSESLNHFNQIADNINVLHKLGFNILDTYEEKTIYSKIMPAEKQLDKILINSEYSDAISIIQKFIEELTTKLTISHNLNKDSIFNKYKIQISDEMNNKLNYTEYGFYDLIFQNCFYIDNKFYFYDQEWIEKNVPIEFIIYRAIEYLGNTSSKINKDKLFKEFKIDECILVFRELESLLQKEIKDNTIWTIHSKNGLSIHDLYYTKVHYNNLYNLNKNENQELKKQIDRLEKTNDELEKKNNELNNELNGIKNSRSWKIIRKIRHIK